ncbi:MAG TPA: Hsp20/alpha crystallin family protein [Aggregatilineales bacterium]|nr:Hsp20/alpha crystallin family protein [Aggregatilineales bacterium]
MVMRKLSTDNELMTMRDFFDRWFEESRSVLDYAGGPRVARLPIDAYSTDNEIVVMAPIPGARPEDVEITVEGDTLTIRGEVEPRLEDVKYLFAERFHGPFMRELRFNVPVNVDQIEAHFENGLLTLNIPKAEEVRPRVIPVRTGVAEPA